MKSKFKFICLGVFLAMACKSPDKIEQSDNRPYTEPHRPQFHFSPKAKWMNDPNGMVYLDGEYHLFYQHYPDSDVWGPMHWGHAVSKDMLHWEHLPIALYPDSLGMVFSGSAVYDKDNTSGFGTTVNPPLVAIFTYHKMEWEKAGRNDYQTQGIAFSLDKGRTWTKYDKNPVIKNPGIKDFRDPKVFWHEESKSWIVTLAVLDHVEFYGSKDLKSWNKLGDFGKEYGSHGGVWECPDLFALDVPGQQSKKWVLLLSINPGGPNGGSATQYFIGNFDGKTFSSDRPKSDTLWIDHGPDNYAGVTWSNIPPADGRRIFLGWMGNWNYAQVVPTTPWRSAMTIPRELQLAQVDNQLRLTSKPAKEMELIMGEGKQFSALQKDTVQLTDLAGFPLTTSMVSGVLPAKSFTLHLANDQGEHVKVGFNAGQNSFYIDRGKSGDLSFSPKFNAVSKSPRISKEKTISFTAYIDVASIEIFFDNGVNVMTGIFFPHAPLHHFKIYSEDGTMTMDSLTVKEIKRVW